MNDGEVEEPPKRRYLLDCAGLHEVATTQSNSLKAACLERLKEGAIGVSIRAWQEFAEVYEDEAEELAPYVIDKIRTSKACHQGVASIADKQNSRFSLSRYDTHSDLFTAAIALIEGCTVLTIPSQVAAYKALECCKVAALTEVLD